MSITSALAQGVTEMVATSGDSLNSLLQSFGEATGLFGGG
jgi:hypothetical protein